MGGGLRKSHRTKVPCNDTIQDVSALTDLLAGSSEYGNEPSEEGILHQINDYQILNKDCALCS
jgi:hypothetical protein